MKNIHLSSPFRFFKNYFILFLLVSIFILLPFCIKEIPFDQNGDIPVGIKIEVTSAEGQNRTNNEFFIGETIDFSIEVLQTGFIDSLAFGLIVDTGGILTDRNLKAVNDSIVSGSAIRNKNIFTITIDQPGTVLLVGVAHFRDSCIIDTFRLHIMNNTDIPTPPDDVSASPAIICSGNTSELSVHGTLFPDDAQWIWYEGSCSGEPIDSGKQKVTVTPSKTTTYYVRAGNSSDISVCISTKVTVLTAFIPGSISGGGATICYGGNPGIMTANPSGGLEKYSYQWYYRNGKLAPDNSKATPIPGAMSRRYDPPSLEITRTYRCKVDAIGTPDCGDAAWTKNSITVEVLNRFNPGNITGVTKKWYCADDNSVTMTANPTGGSGNYKYQWYYVKVKTIFTDKKNIPIKGATERRYKPTLNYSNWKKRTYRCKVTPIGKPACGGPAWTNNTISIEVRLCK